MAAASTSAGAARAAASAAASTMRSSTSKRLRPVAGALVSRAPLLSRTPSDFERSYMSLIAQAQQAATFKPPSVTRDWFFKKGSTGERAFNEAQAAGKGLQAQENEIERRRREYEDLVASSKGEDSLEREPSKTLYLLVRKKRAEHAWQLPQGGVKQGESLLEAAQRELREETGDNLDVWPIARVPAGAYSYEHKALEKDGAKYDGSHVFFVPMRALRGSIELNKAEGLDSYAWLTASEIESRVSRDYWLAIRDMLSE